MAEIVLNTESTTLVLNGTPINDMVNGDVIVMTPTNPLTSRVNGTNDSVAIAKRSDAGVTSMVIRVFRFSDSDVFMNSIRNSAEPVVINGSLKSNFKRNGIDGTESYILESGSVTTQPTDTKSDTEGNALMEYTVEFRNARRNI